MEKEKTNKAMDMKISNNHIVFEVETNAGKKNVLLDTGAGSSRSFDTDVYEVTINGETFPTHLEPVEDDPALATEVSRLIGTKVSAFVGPDVLETADVLIDFEKNTIEFGAAKLDGGSTIYMDIHPYTKLPLLKMTVNERELNVGFDTGAQYPFVLVELVNELNIGEPIGQFPDYNPNLGHFTPDLYRGKIKLGTCELDGVKIAVHPKYDETVWPLDGFLGINCLIENKVKLWISYANSQMVIVK